MKVKGQFSGRYEPMSQGNLVLPSWGHKKIEAAAGSSKILATIDLITQSHIPEHQHKLNIHDRENFETHTIRETAKRSKHFGKN